MPCSLPLTGLQQLEGILLVNRNWDERGASSATIADSDSLAAGRERGRRAFQTSRAFQTNREVSEGGAMADVLNLVMLICASIGSLAFGILAAYGILRAGFAAMKPREQRAVVKAHAQAAHIA